MLKPRSFGGFLGFSQRFPHSFPQFLCKPAGAWVAGIAGDPATPVIVVS
jgi:hypothetical protein